MKMENMNRFVKLQQKIAGLQQELEDLKPALAVQLYAFGYSTDNLVNLLRSGKTTILKMLKENGVQMRSQGRKVSPKAPIFECPLCAEKRKEIVKRR